MELEKKQKTVLSIFKFYKVFQDEFLDVMPGINNTVLSPLLYKILSEIHLYGKITASVLCKRVSVSFPNMSRSINTLEKLGYITKAQDAIDKRITNIYLSNEGVKLIRDSLENMDKELFKKFDGLSSDELEELQNALERSRELILKMGQKL